MNQRKKNNIVSAIVVTIICIIAECVIVYAQKPAEPIVVDATTAQEIRVAAEAQDKARVVYEASQAKTEAAIWKAKAKAKCPDCTLSQNAKGELVLIPDPPKP